MPTSRAADISSPRGERIVLDDPWITGSVAERERIASWWNEALPGRLNDQKPVFIMARLHEVDIPGIVLLGDLGGYAYLTIPPEQG